MILTIFRRWTGVCRDAQSLCAGPLLHRPPPAEAWPAPTQRGGNRAPAARPQHRHTHSSFNREGSTVKFLVLGATGRTGVLFVKKALDEGHQVTALVRRAGSAVDPRAQIVT